MTSRATATTRRRPTTMTSRATATTSAGSSLGEPPHRRPSVADTASIDRRAASPSREQRGVLLSRVTSREASRRPCSSPSWTPPRSCSTRRRRRSRSSSVTRIASSSGSQRAPRAPGVIGVSVPPSKGIVGYVFSTGQAIALSDVLADPRFDQATAQRTGYVPRSIAAVPLIDGATTVGVLQVLDKRGRPSVLAAGHGAAGRLRAPGGGRHRGEQGPAGHDAAAPGRPHRRRRWRP